MMGLDGKQWLFDEQSWTLADWFIIKNATGMGRIAFLNGLLEEDPACLQALMWFLRRPDEPNLRLEEVMFKPASLTWEEVEQPQVAPDPPVAAVDDESPPISANDGTTTSTTSPVSATSLPVMLTP
jgi:hypothetical protein